MGTISPGKIGFLKIGKIGKIEGRDISREMRGLASFISFIHPVFSFIKIKNNKKY